MKRRASSDGNPGNSGPGPAQPRRAFSLIELLVVLAIMIILATMLSSHLSVNHRRSALALCRQNLQEIFLAVTIYAGDNQGAYPLLQAARTSAAPLSRLLPRCTTETAIFICPSSSDPPLPEGEPFAQRRISYAYYMGRNTNKLADDAVLSDWQVNNLPKQAGQPLFSADGKTPGNNHQKDGGNLLLGSGVVQFSRPAASRELPLPPGITLLNPRP